jgi:hypothetical protein
MLISKQVGTANKLAKPFIREHLAGQQLLFQPEIFHDFLSNEGLRPQLPQPE